VVAGRTGVVGRLWKAHQSLDVLGYRCQDELLPHELQSAQAQATTNQKVASALYCAFWQNTLK
jgi:hypothetical protein